MCFVHVINSDCQTRLLNVLGQIAMILGDKKNPTGGMDSCVLCSQVEVSGTS